MSHADDDTTTGYADAAPLYWEAGWRGILPLHRGFKGGEGSGLPSGYTGHQGIDTSYADILSWSEMERYRNGNLALRLPDGVVGIDVDAYGVKTGAAALDEAQKRWGPLPAGPRSSSRLNDPTSGIRLFRVPMGVMLSQWIVFPDLGIGDIEICQHHHRYVVAWPSIHPEQRPYWWRDADMNFIEIPKPDELLWLPDEWRENLKLAPRANLYTGASVDVDKALTKGEPTLQVADRLRQAVKELNLPGQSRHDTTCRHVLALMRLGVTGHAGVKHALDVLGGVFIATVTADGSRSPESARGEFERMIFNDNAARELAQPGINDWVGALIVEESPHRPESAPDHGENTPETGSDPSQGGEEGSDTDANDSGENRSTSQASRPASPLQEIEQGFWESRESLAMVWQTSMAQMASPWATLGICAARALTLVRPNATLPPLIGGPGSLNFFVALVARSGGGKGAAGSAADLLIPDSLFQQRNLGSGEGLVRLFDRPKNDDGTQERHEALLINVDEVDTLGALSQRNSSTTSTVLRSAFSGEALGWSYINRAGLGDVPKHSYRLTMVVSVQPKQSATLLREDGGGLPQRFMWVPAKDPRIPDDDLWPTGPLALPPGSEWLYPRTIVIPEEVKRFIKANRRKDQRDELDALDGHAVFVREKFAFALAVLDGRTEMSMEDWELSGIAAEVSDYARNICREQLRAAGRVDAIERGEIRGVELAAADESKQYEEAERVRHALRWALSKIESAGESGISQRDLTVGADSKRTRRWLPAALQIGVSNGLIRQLDGTTTWVKI
jgi:hypothetical protein